MIPKTNKTERASTSWVGGNLSIKSQALLNIRMLAKIKIISAVIICFILMANLFIALFYQKIAHLATEQSLALLILTLS